MLCWISTQDISKSQRGELLTGNGNVMFVFWRRNTKSKARTARMILPPFPAATLYFTDVSII